MSLGNERHNNSSACFKSIVVGTGNGGSGAAFYSDDKHEDENCLGIPEYTIASLPTIAATNKNTFGVALTSGSATLLVKNWKDGSWYRFNGTKI